MLRKTGEWDVRCSSKLRRMFPKPRKGWWYKINRKQARRVVRILSKLYKITPPEISENRPEHYGSYFRGVIEMHGRAHVKTVFHEFYHHLDYKTRGKYNSSDNKGGESSYGWQFADLMFEAMR